MPRHAATGLLLAALALLPAAALAQSGIPPRRGPLAARDEWLLAQPLLSLPATAPDPLGRGRSELRLDGDWGSDFGLAGAFGGPEPSLRMLVDGEHRSAALGFQRGITRGLTVGVRVPVVWRGAGLMDGIIDWWHDALGFPDAGRSLEPNDRLRVEGRDTRGGPVRWEGRAGTALGNVELEAHQVLLGAGPDAGWRLATVARLSAPTATGTFAHAGTAAGVQLLGAGPLASRATVYFGLGTTFGGFREFQGIAYRRTRPQGFVSLEGRLTRGWSLILQIDAAARLVTSIEGYPGTTAYLRVGSKFDVAHGWTIDAGITEGVKSEIATTDFGVRAGVGRRF
jgi:hypothetical protein